MWSSRHTTSDPTNRSYRSQAIVAGLLAVVLAVGAGALLVKDSDQSGSSSPAAVAAPVASNPVASNPTVSNPAGNPTGPATQNPTGPNSSPIVTNPSSANPTDSGSTGAGPPATPADDGSSAHDASPAPGAGDPAGADPPAGARPPITIPLPDIHLDPDALARTFDLVGPTIDAHFDADTIQDIAPGRADCPGHPGTLRSRLIVHVSDPSGVASVKERVTVDGHTTDHELDRLGGDAWDGETFGGFALAEARDRWVFGVRIDARDNRGNLSSQLALITVVPCH